MQHRQQNVRLKNKSNSPNRVESSNETMYRATGAGVLLGNYNRVTTTGMSLKDFHNHEQHGK